MPHLVERTLLCKEKKNNTYLGMFFLDMFTTITQNSALRLGLGFNPEEY